jgi:hypothetical protein
VAIIISVKPLPRDQLTSSLRCAAVEGQSSNQERASVSAGISRIIARALATHVMPSKVTVSGKPLPQLLANVIIPCKPEKQPHNPVTKPVSFWQLMSP